MPVPTSPWLWVTIIITLGHVQGVSVDLKWPHIRRKLTTGIDVNSQCRCVALTIHNNNNAVCFLSRKGLEVFRGNLDRALVSHSNWKHKHNFFYRIIHHNISYFMLCGYNIIILQ